MAGYGQQTLEWIATNMAWFNYHPRNVMDTKHQVTEWNQES